jgi:hypothetical protein
MTAVGESWRNLTDEERKNYPPLGHDALPRALGDLLPSREKLWVQKRSRTFESVKNLVQVPLRSICLTPFI